MSLAGGDLQRDRRLMMATIRVIAVFVAAASCDYNADIEDCRVACTASSGCPSGFECSVPEMLCRDPSVAASCPSILDGGDRDAPPMLSCSSLASSCGPTGTASCCGSPLVPGGTFDRSYDVGSDGMYPSTAYPATVGDFRLDTYEVTVGRFRQFVNASMGTQANPPSMGAGARTLNGMTSQGGWDRAWNGSLTANTSTLVAGAKCGQNQSWTDTPGANEALPMNCITWFEAFAFCVWDGGFLPTEAEWNYAAAGGSEQRAYPWSNPASSLTIDCSYANYGTGGTAYCVNPPYGAVNRVGGESPKGDGKYGQADLAGNIWEWTLDWYQSQYGNPCNDCADLTAASSRVVRGGNFAAVASYLRGASRLNLMPDQRSYWFGVRCARSAP
jgi:sulfatase modifying factor 1